MKFRQIDESLDYIMTGNIVGAKGSVLSTTLEDRVARAKKIVAEDATFLPLIQIATDPNLKIDGLKEGMPSQIKLERNIPAGISDTTIRQEWRRVKSFLPKGAYENVKPIQREKIWIQLLEGINWKEANILTMIKDQTLMAEFEGLREVLEQLNVVPVSAPTPTTFPPQVKEAIKTNIEIVTTVGKQKAVASADTSIKKKATTKKKKNAPKEPVWMPVGTVDGSLLDAALASAPKKKAAKKKAAKAVVLDDSTPSEEEFNEMSAKSAELNEERNKKIIEFTDQADIIKFLGEYGEHSKQVLKELRDTQLARRKASKK